MSFNENEHPRDKDGKFTDGAGEGSAAKIRRVEKKHFPHLPHLTSDGDGGKISTNLQEKKQKMNLQFFAEKETDLPKQETASIKRSMRKISKRIEEHREKIVHPEIYAQDWSTRSKKRKQDLLDYWRNEIQEFEKSLQRRVDELKKRGEYDGE